MAKFIFFVRTPDDVVQEWSFEADSTKHAIKLLNDNAPEGTDIMSCYKEVKTWNKYSIKKIS